MTLITTMTACAVRFSMPSLTARRRHVVQVIIWVCFSALCTQKGKSANMCTSAALNFLSPAC